MELPPHPLTPHADLVIVVSGTTYNKQLCKYMCTVSAHVKKACVADNTLCPFMVMQWQTYQDQEIAQYVAICSAAVFTTSSL